MKYWIRYRRTLLWIPIAILFGTVNGFSQDRPSGNPPVLPFQLNASDNTDDQLASQYFQNKEFLKAAEIYERLYENKPTSSNYFYYLFCLIEIREFEKAEKLIKSARKEDPQAMRYMVDLGYLYFREGNADKSRKLYEEALKKLNGNQQQVGELAAAFISKNENEYAIRTYMKGRQLMNNPSAFAFEMASIYDRTGDLSSMLDEYFLLLEVNRSYLQTIQDRLQNVLANDVDGSRNELFRKYLLEKVQKEPDKSLYSELLWWYSIQEKDFEMALIQAKSLDRRLKEDGNRVFQLAQLCNSNEDFNTAIDAFRYLINKGSDFPFYYSSRSEILMSRFLQTLNKETVTEKELAELEDEFHSEIKTIGKNPNSALLIKNLAHLDAFYLKKTDEAIELLTGLTEMTGLSEKVRAECKLELADILLFSDDVWEATLLYQQVYKDFKNDALGELAKFKNARLTFYIGEFKWAQTQLDILKAATSRLISNDAIALSLLISENFDDDSNTVALGFYSRADLLEYRNEYETALKTLDSIAMAFSHHSISDEVLLKKSEIRMKQKKYSEADTLLGELISGYPGEVLADEGLIRRARLNEIQLHNPNQAMVYYEDLLTRYPGSVYAIEARKRFRNLRGDKGF